MVVDVSTIETAPISQEDMLDQKLAAWNAKRQEVDHIADSQNERIDEGIKETVVSLNMLGINTIASCEGHNDFGVDEEKRRPLTPWVEIAAPNEPKNKLDQTTENCRTPEWEEWKRKSDELGFRVQEYLGEFYKNRTTEPVVAIHAELFLPGDGMWRIFNGDKQKDSETLPAISRDKWDSLLRKRQAEMAAFTSFLKDKYFAS